jgi:hypothetical protein
MPKLRGGVLLLRDRLVSARIRLVVEDVHCAVAHLQEIHVSGDRLRPGAIVSREVDNELFRKDETGAATAANRACPRLSRSISSFGRWNA